MDSLKPQLPKISNEGRIPLVDVLLELLAWQQKTVGAIGLLTICRRYPKRESNHKNRINCGRMDFE